HIIEPPSREFHVSRLREAGIDAERAEATGQLEFVSWDEMYLPGGNFDQRGMIGRIRGALSKAAEQGFSRARLVGHMEWASGDVPGVRDLAEYEARMNEMPDFEDVIVCAYDLTRFSAKVIFDVFRSHQAVVVAGRLSENPFYTPPAQLIAELISRA